MPRIDCTFLSHLRKRGQASRTLGTITQNIEQGNESLRSQITLHNPTNITQGLFLILVGRAQAPVWDISANHHIEPKKPMPYVNHYSFHILDPQWGHITLKSAAFLRSRPR
jgi:hypothetical protein